MTLEEIEQKIEKETELIKKLETGYPELNNGVGFYDEANKDWHIYHTQVKDAYWRRRRLWSELEKYKEG